MKIYLKKFRESLKSHFEKYFFLKDLTATSDKMCELKTLIPCNNFSSGPNGARMATNLGLGRYWRHSPEGRAVGENVQVHAELGALGPRR